MELPNSTVLGVTLRKLKVFTFIASMTVIASVVYPVIPFMSYIKAKYLLVSVTLFYLEGVFCSPGVTIVIRLLMSDF